MSIKLTILCENIVERIDPGGLIGEHGFACHLQTGQGDYLFDTGIGLGLVHNSKRLRIDLTQLRGIILSHGHVDHTGGLHKLLKEIGPIPIYAHPDLFSRRYGNITGELRDIGIPWSKAELEQLGGDFRLATVAQKITPELTASGEIPRTGADTGDANLVVVSDQGQSQIDPIADDLSLFINSDKGLIILLGCAHAGLFNIIEHAIKVTGQRKIHMLLGGTHLKFSSEQQLEATLDRLDDYQIDKIGVSHCTGLQASRKIAERFGERFFYASVGTEIEV
jgi:7,8-dihydropterin-6-yl-methyl-4-(beta-D-ribofuranosyl)aminobenzene 5'-phosphate synthase